MMPQDKITYPRTTLFTCHEQSAGGNYSVPDDEAMRFIRTACEASQGAGGFDWEKHDALIAFAQKHSAEIIKAMNDGYPSAETVGLGIMARDGRVREPYRGPLAELQQVYKNRRK